MTQDDTEDLPHYYRHMARLQALQSLADRGKLSRSGRHEHRRLAAWLVDYGITQRQVARLDVVEFLKCCERSVTPEKR